MTGSNVTVRYYPVIVQEYINYCLEGQLEACEKKLRRKG